MYAKCLIGKKVIRSGPNKYRDNSFSDYPIRIISANDCHIVYEHADDWHQTYMDTDRHALNGEWCDNNWIEYHSGCHGLKLPDWAKPYKDIVKVNIGCKSFEVSKEKAKALIDLLE